MSLREILKKTITDYTDLDMIYKSVISEKFYKIGTIDRGLRHLAEQGIIRPVFQNNYIIAYKPTKEKKQEHLFDLPRITH